MKHAIDPKVDCVFKALLGAPENSNLLVNFLNAMLSEHLEHPISQVEILNPYNEREYFNDKLSIVDIKAQDTERQVFQIEIQLSNYPSLPARILYNWADIYSQQLKSGEKYGELKASYAIWLLNENLYADNDCMRHFQVRDAKGRPLIDHCHITLVELKKFHSQVIHNNQERWLQFFNQAEYFDDLKLPGWMNTQEMKQAMNTLSRFSEQDREYFAYQARQEYIRQQNTMIYELEQESIARQKAADAAVEEAQQEVLKSQQEVEKSQQEVEKSQQEVERSQQEVEKSQQEVEKSQQEVEKSQQETEKARREVAEAQQDAAEAEQEKKDALAELAELKKLLASQKNQQK